MSAGQAITISASIGDSLTGTIKGSTVIAAPSLGNVPICPDAMVSLAATPSGDQQIYPSAITAANIQALGFIASLVTAGTGTPGVIVKLKGASGLSAVNAIYDFFVVDSGGTGAGTFTLTVEGVTTAPITYSATYGTLESNINSALTTAGIGATCSGGSLGAVILTFSSGRHVGRPIFGVSTTVVTWTGTSITVDGNTFSSSTVGTSYTITRPRRAFPRISISCCSPRRACRMGRSSCRRQRRPSPPISRRSPASRRWMAAWWKLPARSTSPPEPQPEP